jgi:hypothetical protein
MYNALMAQAASRNIPLRSLPKRTQSVLRARAKRLGFEPGEYAIRLIDFALRLEDQAETQGFGQIMRPVRLASGEVSEAEIVKLVTKARTNGRRAKG